MQRTATHLSSKEKRKLIEIRNNYIEAVVKRSLNNPSSFDTNITFLKEQLEVTKTLKSVMQLHAKQSQNQKINNFNIFSLFNTAKAPSAQDKIMQKVKTLLYSQTVLELMKSMLAKEPRIVSLDCNIKKNSIKHANTTSSDETTEMDIIEYKIVFSDDAVLLFYSLNDNDKLAQTRAIYEDHMQRLAHQNKLTH